MEQPRADVKEPYLPSIFERDRVVGYDFIFEGIKSGFPDVSPLCHNKTA